MLELRRQLVALEKFLERIKWSELAVSKAFRDSPEADREEVMEKILDSFRFEQEHW